MAYAAYLESPGCHLVQPSAPDRPQWWVMDVIVPSRDALSVRRALAPCPDAGILRCVPGLDDNRVRLEIRLASHRVDEVMQRVMACVPCGQLGPLISWRCHLRRHGLVDGL